MPLLHALSGTHPHKSYFRQMKTQYQLTLLACTVLLSGCFAFSAYDKTIDGPYRLVAIDTMDQMSVSYDLGDGSSIGRIGATVFAVGWSKEFIVAKRHPSNNKETTEYFYLTRSSDSKYADPSVSVTGPLTEAEFNVRRKGLGLPEFTMEIRSLK